MSNSLQSSVAYLNGEYLSFGDMRIPVTDGGFMQGVTVAEQMRTFNGVIFRLQPHLSRLRRSLEITGIEIAEPVERLGEIAKDLVSRNLPQLSAGDDLGITVFITPGPYLPSQGVDEQCGPTIGLHTRPISFVQWANKYETGERLTVTGTRQISAQNWPPELKCRSRMHYYLADREARSFDPNSRALLLDLDGNVSEASTANVLAYTADRGFVSPPQGAVLPGISLAMVEELAAELRIPFHFETMKAADFANADEVLLCSTSPCVLPVVAIDNRPIGRGEPGSLFHRLIQQWGSHVGLDIIAQARRFAHRI